MVKPNVTLRFVSLTMNISASTGKNIKSVKNYVVSDHMLFCNSIVSFEDFSVLAKGTNNFRRKLQEILLTHHELNKSQLNTVKQSF